MVRGANVRGGGSTLRKRNKVGLAQSIAIHQTCMNTNVKLQEAAVKSSDRASHARDVVLPCSQPRTSHHMIARVLCDGTDDASICRLASISLAQATIRPAIHVETDLHWLSHLPWSSSPQERPESTGT
jgi:hypothetical protein